VKLVLQRADGDCGVAALATLTESTYEDIYSAMMAVDPTHCGRSGVHLTQMIALGKMIGVDLAIKRPWDLDTDEGLLVIRWRRRRKVKLHLVALGSGVIVDPADGQILAYDDYFTRCKAAPDAFLELR
jgi:hypothetical protein